PGRQAYPGTRSPNFVGRSQRSAGVGDGPATHGAAMKHGDVTEEPHAEEAFQTQRRAPEPAIQKPTRARQGRGRPAAAHFHDRDAITFFGKAQGGNAAPETRTDDDKIEVVG